MAVLMGPNVLATTLLSDNPTGLTAEAGVSTEGGFSGDSSFNCYWNDPTSVGHTVHELLNPEEGCTGSASAIVSGELEFDFGRWGKKTYYIKGGATTSGVAGDGVNPQSSGHNEAVTGNPKRPQEMWVNNSTCPESIDEKMARTREDRASIVEWLVQAVVFIIPGKHFVIICNATTSELISGSGEVCLETHGSASLAFVQNKVYPSLSSGSSAATPECAAEMVFSSQGNEGARPSAGVVSVDEIPSFDLDAVNLQMQQGFANYILEASECTLDSLKLEAIPDLVCNDRNPHKVELVAHMVANALQEDFFEGHETVALWEA